MKYIDKVFDWVGGGLIGIALGGIISLLKSEWLLFNLLPFVSPLARFFNKKQPSLQGVWKTVYSEFESEQQQRSWWQVGKVPNKKSVVHYIKIVQINDIVLGKNLDDNSSYKIIGKIENFEHLSGTWEDHTIGIHSGAFQLCIRYENDRLLMYGIWIGYSTQQAGTIQHGPWKWEFIGSNMKEVLKAMRE